MIVSLFELVRAKDWLKNFIIFLPIIFSEKLSNYDYYNNLIIAFIIFSLTASLIYIINDITDIKIDKLHPIKRNKKPIANGSLSIQFAVYILIFIFTLIVLLIYLNPKLLLHVSSYIFLNFLYNFFLKKIPILDIILLSIGYVIRLDVGSLVISVQSSWLMVVTIFFLAFFVLSLKRMAEFNIDYKKRDSLAFYTTTKLNILIFSSGFLFVFFYSFYIIILNNNLVLSLPIIFFFIYRYYKKAIYKGNGEFPIDLVLRDKILLFTSLLFISYLLIIYY